MNGPDLLAGMAFARKRTLDLLDKLAKEPRVQEALGWRPGPGKAHLAWQLMHIGATDDRHLNVRMKQGEPAEPQLVQRFAGGSTPDEEIPGLEEIRGYLEERRRAIVAHLEQLRPEDLGQKPNDQAPWTYGEWMHVLAWHEAHHQGQAHLTYNLFKAHGGE